MNRRRFLQSLAGLALGACVGVQRVLPLAIRPAEPWRTPAWLMEWERILHDEIDRMGPDARAAMGLPMWMPPRPWFSLELTTPSG